MLNTVNMIGIIVVTIFICGSTGVVLALCGAAKHQHAVQKRQQ